jgi:hypothetical protein
MVDPNFINHITDKLQQRYDQISTVILSGRCSTYEEYKRLTGELQGIAESSTLIAKEAKKANQ